MYGKTGPSKWWISIFSNAPGLYSDTVPLNEGIDSNDNIVVLTCQISLVL